jgi:hypothetical protein
MVGIAILKLSDVPISEVCKQQFSWNQKNFRERSSDLSDKILTRNSIKCKEAAHNKILDSSLQLCNAISGA